MYIMLLTLLYFLYQDELSGFALKVYMYQPKEIKVTP